MSGRADTKTADAPGGLLTAVRKVVRTHLLSAPAYLALDRSGREQMARAMVRVCHAAAALAHEEAASDAAARANQSASLPAAASTPRPLATAQAAGDSFSGVSAAKVAGTTQAILNAVSFPRFVTDLINGVFKSMLDSGIQQLNTYVELLNNVAASTEGFSDSNLGADRARGWLAERYPDSFDLQREPGDSEGDGQPGPAKTTLLLKPGASMPSPEALKTDLGLADSDPAPSGDPEATLVPLARRRLAKMRQEMLATMVMLGLQRIVIESGRISAAMRFHIDTRSAAQEDRGSTFDWKNQLNVAGSYGFGPWGVSASMSNTIGYVSTQRTQTTEEMNTDLDLNSSVEINFKSDYLPLNRLASADQVGRIRANTRNPDAEEAKAAEEARAKRAASAAAGDEARRSSLDRILTPSQPTAPAPGSPGTVGAAEKARKDAADQAKKEKSQPSAGKANGGPAPSTSITKK
jgi:hypothetical protein